MKTLAVLILLALMSAAGFAQVEPDEYVPLKTEHDRFKDETTVQTGHMKVAGTKYDNLSIMFGYFCKGKTPAPKQPLVIMLARIKKNEEPVTIGDLDVIAGEKRFSITGFSEPIMTRVTNFISIHQGAALLPFDKALEIARASKVEMRVGGLEFSLSQKQINALRRLIKQVDPSLSLKEE